MKRSSLQQTGLHSSEVGLLNKSSAQALCVIKLIVVDMILVTFVTNRIILYYLISGLGEA